ncbi:MAG TPA: hypothetical protein VEK35_06520 [Roseiarcus sp.]|nr:hypothetical protein [Roseiarcus sp.]
MALAGPMLRIALAAVFAFAIVGQEQVQAAGPAGGPSAGPGTGSSSGSSSSSSASTSSGSASSSSSSSSGASSSSASSSSGAGSGSSSGGADGAGHGAQFSGPPASVASYAKPATRAVENAINACRDRFVDQQQCIADALDAYAEALRELPLPPDLRGLPVIVSRAAHQVRVARTRAEATKAIKIAIAEVHKTIALLKADDPAELKAATRDGSFVAETLMVADGKLEKAVGL